MKYFEVTFADKEEFGVTSNILPRTKEEIQRWNDREPLSMDTYSEKNLENEIERS